MTPSFRNVLLLLLSLAAGCVDALGFLSTGVFPANMTGNSVMLALALVRRDIPGITYAGLALTGFLVGALCGGLELYRREEKCVWPWKASAAICLAGVLLLGVGMTTLFSGGTHIAWLIALAALAMGLQSTAVLAIGVPGIATTVVTGALATAMGRIGSRFTNGERSRKISEASAGLPAASWAAYFAGAMIGGLNGIIGMKIVMAVPIISLIGVAVLAEMKKRRSF